MLTKPRFSEFATAAVMSAQIAHVANEAHEAASVLAAFVSVTQEPASPVQKAKNQGHKDTTVKRRHKASKASKKDSCLGSAAQATLKKQEAPCHRWHIDGPAKTNTGKDRACTETHREWKHTILHKTSCASGHRTKSMGAPPVPAHTCHCTRSQVIAHQARTHMSANESLNAMLAQTRL